MLTLDALKDLYVAAGGEAAAVADAVTNVEVLNAIAVLNGGDGGAVLIPDAVEQIAENYSGGGESIETLFSQTLEITASSTAVINLYRPRMDGRKLVFDEFVTVDGRSGSETQVVTIPVASDELIVMESGLGSTPIKTSNARNCLALVDNAKYIIIKITAANATITVGLGG